MQLLSSIHCKNNFRKTTTLIAEYQKTLNIYFKAFIIRFIAWNEQAIKILKINKHQDINIIFILIYIHIWMCVEHICIWRLYYVKESLLFQVPGCLTVVGAVGCSQAVLRLIPWRSSNFWNATFRRNCVTAIVSRARTLVTVWVDGPGGMVGDGDGFQQIGNPTWVRCNLLRCGFTRTIITIIYIYLFHNRYLTVSLIYNASWFYLFYILYNP